MNKRVARIVIIILVVVAAAIALWKNDMLPIELSQQEPSQEEIVGSGDNEVNTGSVATGDTTGTGEFDPESFNDPEIEELIQLLEELVQE